jgi:hypothetical protein
MVDRCCLEGDQGSNHPRPRRWDPAKLEYPYDWPLYLWRYRLGTTAAYVMPGIAQSDFQTANKPYNGSAQDCTVRMHRGLVRTSEHRNIEVRSHHWIEMTPNVLDICLMTASPTLSVEIAAFSSLG